MSTATRLLKPIVDVREHEAPTVLLMFLYSFLAMTSYTMLKPATRSTFINSLGADNLPYVLLVAGFLIAFIMQGYSRAVGVLPRKWVIPIAQAALAGLMIVFFLLFQTGGQWVSVGFYLFGLILGILLISQFWTLANDIFDPRQAKRVFGFIGGGSSLGGIAGSLLAGQAKAIGTYNLLLISAATLALCIVLVSVVLRREKAVSLSGITSTGEESGVGAGEALRLLRSSRHLQIISLVIGFAAIGAGIIEQQLNMAAEAFQGRGADGLTAFLGQVQLYTSVLGFVIQVWLTSYIQRYLGIGFALLILPVSLGTTGVVMLLNAALWAPSLARVLDTSLRYTVDKTTREILFLPLPTDIKYQAKPFVDVTVDRMGKAVSALLSLVLIADWGLNLGWQQMSYASLAITALWVVAAVVAKRGYLAAFRKSIEQRDVKPADVRIEAADLSTIETLIEELADPDERRVVYAIDLLESLDKRHLITPLLLYHESPKVRSRALAALATLRPETAVRWQPHVERLMSDPNVDVRLAALGALATLRDQPVTELVRPYLDDPDPRTVAAAALVLLRSRAPVDLERAHAAFARILADGSESAAPARREIAAALKGVRSVDAHALLVQLLSDRDPEVAGEALRSVRAMGTAEFLFVPALIALLRDRRLKSAARDTLVGYGEPVVDSLAYFMNDPDEDAWVRRQIPATLARIPVQRSIDVLAAALPSSHADAVLHYEVIVALDRLQRVATGLTFDRKIVEPLLVAESQRYFLYVTLHHNLFAREKMRADSLLARALVEKMARGRDRMWLLLGLSYPWKDVAAARWAVERGDLKARSSALEYLDNVLEGAVRKKVLPVFEDMNDDERVRKANSMLATRTRGAEETLLQLINDNDQVVAASAILLVEEVRMWTLADDLEHVLAHRDVRDFFVFEAASWALAEHRLPANRRRTLWLEALPTVEVAERLSRLPLFAKVSVDELFRIAGHGGQARHEPGKTLFERGAAPARVDFLLDGRVTATGADGASQDIDAPAPLGFDELIQDGSMSASVRTADTCVTLALEKEEALTLLANSTELVRGLFSTLLSHPVFAGERLVVRGQPDRSLAGLAAEGIKPVEKVLALQRFELFSKVPVDSLLPLANLARGVVFAAGDTPFAAADRPAMRLMLDGQIALEAGEAEAVTVGSGDAVGAYEALAGVAVGRAGRATSGGAALEIRQDELFDVLGQRPDVTRHLFAALLGARRRQSADALKLTAGH